jgi:D-sedoheptulose 7-phosphate isomerase
VIGYAGGEMGVQPTQIRAPLARDRVRAAAEVYSRLAESADAVCTVAQAVTDAYRAGRKLILFGNGGSAGDAQHIAAEFVGRFQLERDPLPALALTVDGSCLTAIANDYGYDEVFARQLRGLGCAGDVAVGISTSGGSRNVCLALQVARSEGMVTVGLTGGDGGVMRELCDHCLVVPSGETPRIQEGHILLGHVLCELVEDALFPEAWDRPLS